MSLSGIKKKSIKAFVGKISTYALFLSYTILTIYPLFWLAYSSLKTNHAIQKNAFSLPEIPQFINYIEAWEIGRLGLSFFNSMIYTVTSVVFVLLSAMMASYAFAKMPFKRVSKYIYIFIGFGILISTHSVIIPLFIMLLKMGLTNTRLGIILTYTAVSLPLAIFLGTEYIKGLPDSLIESAFIDGAGNIRMFLSIILPMTVPVMVTIGIMTGLASWNEFLLGFIISGPATRGLPPALVAFANPRTPNFHLQFAGLMISILPIVVTYSIFNRRITRGVVAGAIKG